MRQYRDGAVFVRGGHEPGRHRRLQRGLDLARDPAAARRRSTTPRPGSPRPRLIVAGGPVTRYPHRGRRGDAAVGRTPRARVPTSAPGDAGPGRVQRRGRLPGARRGRRLRGAPSRVCAAGAVVVDHGLQAGPGGGRGRCRGPCRAPGPRPRRGRDGRGSRPPAPASRPPPGPPATPRSTRPPTGSVPPPSCSATPSTTRPSRCCSASPAAPAPARSPGCRPRRGRYRPPAPRRGREHHDGRLCGGRGLDVRGTTRTNERPGLRRVRARAPARRPGGRPRPRGRRGAGPHGRPAARGRRRLDELAARARGELRARVASGPVDAAALLRCRGPSAPGSGALLAVEAGAPAGQR